MIREFIIPGEPQGKARPRATIIKGHARVYTPKATASYENLVRLAYMEKYGDEKPLNGALIINISFYFAPPKSAYWPVNSKHNGELKDGWNLKAHTSKPDIDNMEKTVLDGLNGVAFKDDSQIAMLVATKRYSEQPYVHVLIKEY